MSEHARAGLARVLDDLGNTLLDLVCGDSRQSRQIEDIVIFDRLDPPALERSPLVLGVGVDDPAEVVALLDEIGLHGGAGLILRSPVELTAEVAAASARNDVAVLGLAPGTSWMQLAAILRSLLVQDEFGRTTSQEMLGGIPSGDLFALANAVAALLDAPVTIEDRNSHVLAFSGRQEEADPSRVATILDREVSAARTKDLEQRGVFRELHGSDGPLFVEPPESGLEGFTMPRVALAVRAGEEVLGSIWAAVPEPLSDEREQVFREIGPLVALHMLSQRAGTDVEHRLRADLVGTVLEGGTGAPAAASMLGLSQRQAIVLVLGLDEEASADLSHADGVAARRRTADAFAMHLAVAAPGSTTALVGDAAYGIVPLGGAAADAEVRAERLAAEFLERTGMGARGAIGIGAVAETAAALPRSREGADRSLRVVRSGRTAKRVARIGDVGFHSLLIEFGDLMLARGEPLEGPLARLAEYDAKHKTDLVATLQAWLDSFGDVVAASKDTFVHPNTFRYRLRRLAEVGEVDLGDSDVRLALMLQLRLRPGE